MPIVDAAERRLSGHIVETDPRWAPRVPGPPERLERVERRVLQLLKESMLQRQSGYTMRSAYNVTNASEMPGWEPVVMTPLGFPRWRTGERRPADRGGRRDPVSPARPRPGLPDRRSGGRLPRRSGVARRGGGPSRAPCDPPRVIGVPRLRAGPRGAGARAALRPACRLRGARPVRCAGPRRGLRAVSTTSRHRGPDDARRRRRRHSSAETMRADIVERGVPAERVFVVPNGVDAETFSPMPPDPAIRARYDLGERFRSATSATSTTPARTMRPRSPRRLVLPSPGGTSLA